MSDSWVESLRAQFPVTRNTAFFDIAYENCGASFVRDVMEDFFRHKADVHPGLVKAGGAGKGETIGVIAQARQRLADFLNAPSIKNLAFTANTCQAVNLLLQGFPFQPGDNVVVGDMEHVSVLMPCLQLKQRGVECRVVPSPDGVTLPAEALLAHTDARTRVVAVSYVQSRSGYKVDLARLARECHERNIFLITDAIQALGFQRVDVAALGVDALVASGYKGLLATEGVGFLYCGDRLLEQVSPVFAGDSPALTIDRDSWEIRCTDPLDARKLECGTIPFQSIYGLSAGLGRLLDIGLDRVEAHVSHCFEQVYQGLQSLGYTLATPFSPAERCHSMLVATRRNQEMVDYFLEHGVFFSRSVEGYVRISVAPFTDQADIDALLRVAAQWRAAEGDD